MQAVGNITGKRITIHFLDGSLAVRHVGRNRITATIDDLSRDGETQTILGDRYTIRVCRPCRRRFEKVSG